ncbi:uncharacterized protein PAC_12991 [Phialocephala subalpina]|uniref:Uncharacterized protein n=1 Tax=Phialocephala subalpina TaxID=576137 RepID=A0A1L7XDJ1_9HELO|nr:uncharacterized protein PAC_12991 [Phialocephala subalpina]
MNPIIDGIFEDCGFEGPLMGEPIDPSEYHSITLDFYDPKTAYESEQQLNLLIGDRADPERGHLNWNWVKDVTIRGFNWHGFLPIVEHALGKFGGLEIVRWEIDEPVTENILNVLEEKNMKLYFKYENWNQKYDPNNSPLINSSVLYSLTADIEWGSTADYRGMDFLFSAISNSTTLRELDIYSHHEGCVFRESTPEAFPFAYHPLVQFPPLEVLRLDGYDLDERADGGSAWAYRGWEWKDFTWWERFRGAKQVYPERPKDDGRTNLEAWLEVMDWSHLHTLHLTLPTNTTLARLKGETLPALTNMSLVLADWRRNTANRDEILSFVTRTSQPLQSLSIKTSEVPVGGSILEAFLASPNLTEELLHFSYGDKVDITSFLRQDLVSKFLTSATKLESIDIELPRDVNITTDSGLFKDFVDSPTLKRVSLRFPSPDNQYIGISWDSALSIQYNEMRRKYHQVKDDGDEPDPLVNHDTALALFKSMRSKKQGAELEQLELYVGDWDAWRNLKYRSTSFGVSLTCFTAQLLLTSEASVYLSMEERHFSTPHPIPRRDHHPTPTNAKNA